MDGTVLGEHGIAPEDRSAYLVRAQQEWLLSGCTATKEEILSALELWDTEDMPELEDLSMSETEAEVVSESSDGDDGSDGEDQPVLTNILTVAEYDIQIAEPNNEDNVPGMPAAVDISADGSGVQDDGCVIV